MAFGKDSSHLQNISGFGGNPMQRGRGAATRRPSKGGSGFSSVFYWANNFNLTPAPDFDTIRLLDGQYKQNLSHDSENVVEDVLPYWKFIEHYNGERGVICSAGPLFAVKGKANPCPSCDKFWENVRENQALKKQGKKTIKRMSADDRFVWSVFDYSVYFEIPQVDAQGQYKMDPKTNQPYTRWEKGNPQDPRFQNKPARNGMMIPWSVSTPQLDMLMAKNADIGLCCRSCGTRDSIVCTAKYCVGCNALVYNPQATSLSREDQVKINDSVFSCPQCKTQAYLGEQIACQRCPQGARASIFDVDLQVQSVPTGKNNNKTLHIRDWALRPLQVTPEVLATIVPIDLSKKFSPTDAETQRKVMKITDTQPQAVPQQGPSQFAGQYQQPYAQPQQPQQPNQWAAAPQMQPQMQPQQYQPQPQQMPQQMPQQYQPVPQYQPQPMVQQPLPQALPQPQPAFIPYQQPTPLVQDPNQQVAPFNPNIPPGYIPPGQQ